MGMPPSTTTSNLILPTRSARNCVVDASVIIPTRNRAALLNSCLESLCAQSYSKDRFEVIVVDNGSTDSTKDTAYQYMQELQLIYVYEEEPGLHVGRHAGMRSASSDILIYADDDLVALPKWVEAITSAFEDSEVSMVGGNNYPQFEDTPLDWLTTLWNQPREKGRALGALSIIDFGTGCFEMNPKFIWGCNFSVRKDVLLAAGGFHPDALPQSMIKYRGDGESHVSQFVSSTRKKALFDSQASVHHFVPRDRMTVDYFCKRYFNQGISDSYAVIRASSGIPGLKDRIRNFLRAVRWKLTYRLRLAATVGNDTKRKLCDVQSRAYKAYWQGHAFHRTSLANDPGLMDWVLKSDYFNTSSRNVAKDE